VPGFVFGDWNAAATDGHGTIKAPVGRECNWCQESVRAGDHGRIAVVSTQSGSSSYIEHRECVLRALVGGVGHLVDHERYCHSVGSDAGLSYRESALLGYDFVRETHLSPTDEQLMAWRQRVDDTRLLAEALNG
jgi:hypothetical protein